MGNTLQSRNVLLLPTALVQRENWQTGEKAEVKHMQKAWEYSDKIYVASFPTGALIIKKPNPDPATPTTPSHAGSQYKELIVMLYEQMGDMNC